MHEKMDRITFYCKNREKEREREKLKGHTVRRRDELKPAVCKADFLLVTGVFHWF